jgi:hypothetical protein
MVDNRKNLTSVNKLRRVRSVLDDMKLKLKNNENIKHDSTTAMSNN